MKHNTFENNKSTSNFKRVSIDSTLNTSVNSIHTEDNLLHDYVEEASSLMKNICKQLINESSTYNPSQTIETIEYFINSRNKNNRIQYSELSNFLFSLRQEQQRGIFNTNLQKLNEFSQGNRYISNDCKKIIIKLLDHTQLVIYQIENSKSIVEEGISENLKEFKSELKNVEREYITILGIFSGIVLAFVGSLIFSTSVLQYINSISIYRLFFVIILIGLILINALYFLFAFILKINQHTLDLSKKLKWINFSAIIILILIFFAWLFDISMLKTLINNKFYK
ncbi:hypothetical protein MX101_04910 [Streptococcus uberis]|nr:hypothetical protein [Streptococcus uberis]MCK1255408.1 hypothetical protein [Streptococcus uberis]